MDKLYDVFLPIVQDLNTYGGNFTAVLVSRVVLDAIDAGAENDPDLLSLRKKLLEAISGWKGLQDHQTFSALFETYYEAVFYLVAQDRGVPLTTTPAGANKGSTPDFRTKTLPTVAFEVETIDIANPQQNYDTTMLEGMEAHLEAEEAARRRGVGTAVRVISPHGDATDVRAAVEQVMKKLAGNIKSGQYEAAPTILVVSTARTGLQENPAQLRRSIPSPEEACDESGQFYAIAAHQHGAHFFSYSDADSRIRDLGVLERNGLLRDYPFIVGMIFLSTEWSETDKATAVQRAYRLNGIWNSHWKPPSALGTAHADAQLVFQALCHGWNDSNDSRAHLLPAA